MLHGPARACPCGGRTRRGGRLTAAQVDALAALTLDPLPEDRDFPVRSGFEPASIPGLLRLVTESVRAQLPR